MFLQDTLINLFLLCRSNLDPLERNTDDELWEALRIAQLKDIVSSSNAGLGNLLYHYISDILL